MVVIKKKRMEKLILEISDILNSPIGTNEIYGISQPNLNGRIEIMRIENGVNVKILELKTDIDKDCEYCLNKYKQEIIFKDGERQFYQKAPKIELDPFESFTIDEKHRKIDLSDMIRQEIILHFPTISVCSTHCKGICPYCGKDKNMEECNCKEEVVEEIKPLAALKDLIK